MVLWPWGSSCFSPLCTRPSSRDLCGIPFCGEEFLPVGSFWNQGFDCLLWFHTVWSPAYCNLGLTASSTLVRFPAKQHLETSLNPFFFLFVSQWSKRFCQPWLWDKWLRYYFLGEISQVFHLNLITPRFKGAALICVVYFALCCLLHTIPLHFFLLLFNCDFTSLAPPSSLLGFFYLIRKIWWFAGALLLLGNSQEESLLLF